MPASLPTRRLTTRVPSADEGSTLIAFLTRRFTYLDGSAWKEEITAERLLVNGLPAAAKQQLASGDEVTYHPASLYEPEVATDYTVLHEDDDLLVIDKPAPLPCHPGGRYFRHTLWTLLREHHTLEEPLFINRLDRETSGIVVIAKNRKSARHLARQFAEQHASKEYLVVVEGEFPQGEITAQGWLASDPESLVRKKMRFYPAEVPVEGKACCTAFLRLESNNGLSLLRARPQTGRHHQIRATLLALGFPVVGDKLYGVDATFFLRFIGDQLTATDLHRLRIPRQALHANKLTIQHPTSGMALTFSAPLPLMLKNLLA